MGLYFDRLTFVFCYLNPEAHCVFRSTQKKSGSPLCFRIRTKTNPDPQEYYTKKTYKNSRKGGGLPRCHVGILIHLSAR
jgi:hypothetical protein